MYLQIYTIRFELVIKICKRICISLCLSRLQCAFIIISITDNKYVFHIIREGLLLIHNYILLIISLQSKVLTINHIKWHEFYGTRYLIRFHVEGVANYISLPINFASACQSGDILEDWVFGLHLKFSGRTE